MSINKITISILDIVSWLTERETVRRHLWSKII